MISLDAKISIGNRFSLVPLDDQFFFLPNSTEGVAEEKLFALNSVGYFIVQNIDGSRSINELIDCVFSKYEADRQDIADDVVRFIIELKKNNIIDIF